MPLPEALAGTAAQHAVGIAIVADLPRAFPIGKGGRFHIEDELVPGPIDVDAAEMGARPHYCSAHLVRRALSLHAGREAGPVATEDLERVAALRVDHQQPGRMLAITGDTRAVGLDLIGRIHFPCAL